MSKLPKGLYRRLLCLLVLLPTLASANYFYPVDTSGTQSTAIVQRVRKLGLPVQVTTTDDFTRRKIDDYLQLGGRSTEGMLGRADAYFPVFERYLRRYHMPATLKYLAVAESMLISDAVSPATAAGLWQLMPATARAMGLRVDSVVDERLDLHCSTEAAVLVLRDLYGMFGNWHLTLAAYNAGPGRVLEAIALAGSDDYDRVREHLPGETRRYVAAYVAAAYAVNYYDDHGLSPRHVDATKYLRIHRAMGLSKLARGSGIRLATLVRLNPAFHEGYIPSSDRGYLVRLPSDYYDAARLFVWGRDNLVMLPIDENLVAASVLAERENYNPYFGLLGIRQAKLVYDNPTWAVRQMHERLLLNYLEDYRAVASL